MTLHYISTCGGAMTWFTFKQNNPRSGNPKKIERLVGKGQVTFVVTHPVATGLCSFAKELCPRTPLTPYPLTFFRPVRLMVSTVQRGREIVPQHASEDASVSGRSCICSWTRNSSLSRPLRMSTSPPFFSESVTEASPLFMAAPLAH